jgi:hypothetical protein
VTVEARPLHTSNNDSLMSSQPRVRQLGISPDGSNTLASHHSHLSSTGHDSNMGLQDPERILDPWSLTQADAPPDTFIQVQPLTPESPAVPPKASVRDFLGQRPPSELVTNHLGAFFPGAENRRISDRTGLSRISQTVAIPHPPVQQGQDALHPEEKLRIWQLIETQFPTLRPEAKSHLQQLLEAPLLSRTDDRLSHSQDTFVRPPPELVYDHLDEYFKDHNLDQPIVEASSGGTPSTSLDLPPLSVIQSPQGDGRSGHKKSIRVVVDEHKQRIRNRNSMLDPMPNAPDSSTTMVPKRRLSHAHTVNDRSRTPLAIFKWVRGELIGKGTYGRVYLALNATTGEMIAVKQVEIPQTASDRENQRQVAVLEALKSENETLKDLNHPYIVQYLGFEETPMFLSV